MTIPFKDSKTHMNLMRAFAGESQARNRYLFAGSQAQGQKLHVLKALFDFTADQERAHAKVFFDHLKELSGTNITIDGTYPVDISNSLEDLLKAAQHNEYQEHDHDYAEFAKVAEEEGFLAIAKSFELIAKIEKCHGDRFGRYAGYMATDTLFKSADETEWLCLNCGHIHKGKEAPKACPVCQHPQGFFVRLEDVPFS
ncbi:MAG: rubrerythrin [Cellulosilyticaceae bacterium]